LALNSTPRRRFGVALGVVMTGVSAGLIGFTGTASAHTPDIDAACKGETTTLNVTLTSYVPGRSPNKNTIKITDGDTVLHEGDFRDRYSDDFEVPGDVAHTFTVSVRAWDDPNKQRGWSFDKKLEVEACVTPPPSSEEPPPSSEEPPPSSSEEPPPSSEEPPPSTTTPAQPIIDTTEPTPTTTPSNVEEEALAETGASVGLPLGIGAVLLAGGGVLLFIVRRRSKA
jgi:hypothetical protein